MALPAPNLDDRTFQDLVREARAMIPRYCPEWTDHNLSDPGITLIELFAWMVETLLYRLNKVPDKNYIKFMDLIGVRLQAPKPAKADVVFRLSASQPESVTIPKGTEVATVRTETREAIAFTTDEDLTVVPPTLAYALTTADRVTFVDCAAELKNPDQYVAVFQQTPQVDDALYLGFGEDLRAETLVLNINSSVEGIGVDPRDPPLAWEYFDAEFEKWASLRVQMDGTGGLNTAGQVVLLIPFSCTMIEVSGQYACWIRCRAIEPNEGQRQYGSSPKVKSINPQCIGGAVSVSNALRIEGEALGRSSGVSGQTFRLQNAPVLERRDGETIEVEGEVEGEYERWIEVDGFYNSGTDDPHFTLDNFTGEIQFGSSVKQPSGQERQYGRIPPAGRRVYFASYRSGGGTAGNVGKETITVLKSSIPYVASVINLDPAEGGMDAETIESAKLRAPLVLRSRTRAVTADDFEYLALEASEEIVRAKCLASGMGNGGSLPPGVVKLLLIPAVSNGAGIIAEEELQLSRHVREEVQTYLDERRLLGTRLEIGVPRYLQVAVHAHVKVNAGADPKRVAIRIEKRLYHYINPVYGGSDGNGWPFGRSIFLPEVFAMLQSDPDVSYIEEVSIVTFDPETGEQQPLSQMNVTAGSVICSHTHEIVAEPVPEPSF